MTPAELMALAQRLLYGCRDPVTGERLYVPVAAFVRPYDAALIVAAVNALPSLLDEVERLRAMLSAAGCMMPTASGFIQLDTNDRAALNAAIDAAVEEESGEQSTSSFENFMEIPDGGR